MEKEIRVGIIGAGASGMMAAIAAAENGAEVTVFEKNKRVGKKILATGNGKCNLSNLDFKTDYYYCEDEKKLHGMFSVFSVWDTLGFFESSGMLIKNKNGYLYPYSEQASTVLDILRKRLEELAVNVQTDTEIKEVYFDEAQGSFTVKEKQEKESFDKVIVACGGPASLKKGEGLTGFEIAEGFGHQVKKPLPGLVQLRAEEGFLKALAGVRCQAEILLLVNKEVTAKETGELQFTDYGISGIPVFQFSRTAALALEEEKSVTVEINFFPEHQKNALLQSMKVRFEHHKGRTLEDFFNGTAHKKINQVILKKEGFQPQTTAEEAGWDNIKHLLAAYRKFELHIKSANSMENAQICAGGVAFSEVNAELESLKQKGLYFVGEVVDVDGKCGGYNLQWAWTSGYIAGRNAAGNSTRNMTLEQETLENELKKTESEQ